MVLSETAGMMAHDGLVRDCRHDGTWACQTVGMTTHDVLVRDWGHGGT